MYTFDMVLPVDIEEMYAQVNGGQEVRGLSRHWFKRGNEFVPYSDFEVTMEYWWRPAEYENGLVVYAEELFVESAEDFERDFNLFWEANVCNYLKKNEYYKELLRSWLYLVVEVSTVSDKALQYLKDQGDF